MKGKKSSKKGVALSINTLVMMILAIVMLGAGLVFFFNMVQTGKSLKGKIDDTIKNRLRSELLKERLGVVPSNVDLEREENGMIGVGVVNKLGEKANFKIKISKKSGSANEWVLYDTSAFPLENNKRVFKSVQVSVPKTASSGQHIFKINIQSKPTDAGGPSQYNNYGSPLRFYVNVE